MRRIRFWELRLTLWKKNILKTFGKTTTAPGYGIPIREKKRESLIS